VDQYLNNRQNEILWNLLADPANNGQLYASNLQNLVSDFPQSGLLHALLSHAEGGQNISRAAAYVNPKALYLLVNSPENLGAITDDRIIQQLSDTGKYAKEMEDADLLKDAEISHLNNFTIQGEQEHSVTDATEIAGHGVIDEPHFTENGIAEHNEQVVEVHQKREDNTFAGHRHDSEASEEIEAPSHEHEIVDDIYEEIAPVEATVEQIIEPIAAYGAVESSQEMLDSTEPVVQGVYQEPVADEQIIEYGPLADEDTEPEIEQDKEVEEVEAEIHPPGVPATDIDENELLTETATFALAEPPHSIDDEVFDEIVGIESISFARNIKDQTDAPVEEAPVIDEEGSPAELFNEPVTQKERALNMDDEAEKLIVGNIAATDYFVFDRAFTERKPAEAAEAGTKVSANGNTNIIPATETQDVSKYDDDTMPYTFLWWLNKTRKEHAGIYQPFKLDTTQAIRQQGADELQQQYYENIFHLSSVEELDRSTAFPPVEFDLKTKEDRIIKRFIVEEPHISTPSAEKLDNENKAKKSSEDQDEMVTETLARIYIDQMLYHKAINTYKKLMLKFPEKSRYFADQIEQLERKTN
jgi:hypothetical protein